MQAPAVVHHSVRFLLGCVVAFVAAGCGGNSVSTTTGPSAVKCATSLSGLPATLPATGTKVQATVTAERECSWSATTDVSWVKLSPDTGQGEAPVTVAVAANDSPVARAGAIVINGARVTLSQAPASCRFDLDRSSAQVTAAGGRVSISIGTMAGCVWKVSSPVPWVGTSRATGSGGAAIELAVEPNPGAARSAVLDVAGRSFTIQQAASGASPGPVPAPDPSPSPSPGPEPPPPAPSPEPPSSGCALDVSPELQRFSKNADTGVITVQTQAGCAWTASASDPWIRITAGAGTGSGEVSYEVERNNNAPRTGTISVGDARVRVEQEGERPVRVSVEGPVSNLTGTCPALMFTVGDRTVFTDEGTRFKDGCAALADGTTVKVDGEEAASGRIYAIAVDLR